MVNKTSTKHSRRTALFLLFGGLAWVLAACFPFPIQLFSSSGPAGSAQSSAAANGEQIYFRSVDQDGNWISYTGGPFFGGMMMGGYLTCASCHGIEARGGVHTMHMQVMDAPPIYFDALVEMAKDDAGLSTYTIDDFRKAVTQGLDVDGGTLSQDMPRWQMSDQDLTDLFQFLHTLN